MDKYSITFACEIVINSLKRYIETFNGVVPETQLHSAIAWVPNVLREGDGLTILKSRLEVEGYSNYKFENDNATLFVYIT